MKTKGFTLIEVMIVVTIVCIIAMLFLGYSKDQTTCINGYVFVQGNPLNKYSTVTQLVDDKGHGIKCVVPQ